MEHPECQPDEKYIGNFTEEQSKQIRYKTKRRGSVARNHTTGDPLDSVDNKELYPYFVKITEHEELQQISTKIGL